MKNDSGALARNDSQVTAIWSLRGRRLHSVPDKEQTEAEQTLVTNPPEMEEDFQDADILRTDEALDALIKNNEREREELRRQIGSADRRIDLAESNIARLGKKMLRRMRDISDLQSETASLKKGVVAHDLFLAEIHRVQLPAMNVAISGLQHENSDLHYRLVALEAKQRRHDRQLTRRLAMPHEVPPATHKGLPGWISIACALILAALGTGLLVALI